MAATFGEYYLKNAVRKPLANGAMAAGGVAAGLLPEFEPGRHLTGA